MRHRKKRTLGLGRDKNRQVMKNLNAALILNETIKVSLKRGKLIKSAVEKLITIGKVDTLHKKRQLFAQLPGPAARKVYEVLGPKYKDRNGGYTRINRIGKAKDGTSMVSLELL
ncbi:MAG: 50S ribosomal protein L17 [Candidatus Doudnabacteria bacterium RIFCSPHIGHO2_01_FULL_43_23]|uniref:50S ribosomal protein L17 n=1 Tax=Candidatus Doudnabacteria bacterium RIFCSPHIGHO2_01_FULL_43_23 TaxID=1817822 RepID=A0A1F5NUC4_9BACT|nr:MAG: 50S ribosomal protein L17 [Candidatus Doudnabacteria bacterium RIFCSPHIGHO2_01_FULL_43_23]